MAGPVSTFLMFQGERADAAAQLYLRAFPEARLDVLERHDAGGVKRAALNIAGHALVLFDSPIPHGFDFTPSVSLFVECADEAELERLFAVLGEGGATLMPPGDYGFSRRFTWITDRFGVSWQLNAA